MKLKRQLIHTDFATENNTYAIQSNRNNNN